MTQHIEEAIERLKLLRKVGFGYDIKDEDRAAIDAVLSALAAAEERGRIEERERCAIETGGVLAEMPPHPPNLMARVLAYLEGSDPKATSGGERNSDLRDWVRKVLEASK